MEKHFNNISRILEHRDRGIISDSDAIRRIREICLQAEGFSDEDIVFGGHHA